MDPPPAGLNGANEFLGLGCQCVAASAFAPINVWFRVNRAAGMGRLVEFVGGASCHPDPSQDEEPKAIAFGCGFNRSMQQIDGIVQPVFRSLVSSSGVR
jgi:hypothetical protein